MTRLQANHQWYFAALHIGYAAVSVTQRCARCKVYSAIHFWSSCRKGSRVNPKRRLGCDQWSDRIRDAKAIAPLNPKGWRKALHLLREFSILEVITTVFVALIALAASQFYYANQRIKEEAKFETKTSDTPDTLTGKINELTGQLARIRITT
jgi:hypothetical protein